jgi:hypothetical protein
MKPLVVLLGAIAVFVGSVFFLRTNNRAVKPEAAIVETAPARASSENVPVAASPSEVAMPEPPATASAPASVAPERFQNLQPAASLFEELLNVPEKLEDRTVTQRWHKTFADEPIDPTLSSNVEPQMQEAMNKAPGAESYEIVSMACRESTCEILAASRTPELGGQANDQFQMMIGGMTREPWWSTYGFTDSSYTVWSAPDGRAVMAAYMSKKKLPR